MNGIKSNFSSNQNVRCFIPEHKKARSVSSPKPLMVDVARVIQNIKNSNAKTKESIEQIQKVSDIILGRKTQFSVDSESGKVVVSIVDPQTNKVIKEIPSAEEQLMREKLKKVAELSLTGSVINVKA